MKISRTLKVWLLVSVAVLLLLVLVLAVRDESALRISTQTPLAPMPHEQGRVEQSDITQMKVLSTLQKPRYVGEDSVGQRWEVAAHEATQMGGVAETLLKLVDVEGRWEGSESLLVRAGEGMYAQTSQTLVLGKGVRVETGDGLGATMDGATLWVVSRTLASFGGRVAVAVATADMSATITADSLAIDNQGNRVVMVGKVKGGVVE